MENFDYFDALKESLEQPLCSTRRCIFSGLPRLNCSRRNTKRRCKSSLGKF